MNVPSTKSLENATKQGRKKVDGKRLTDGTFTPATYVSVEVSFRPVPPVSTRNQTVRVCTYNVTSFAH
jgi:hypothetical protein